MPKCDIEIQKKWDNVCIGFIDRCSNQSGPNTQLALADGRQVSPGHYLVFILLDFTWTLPRVHTPKQSSDTIFPG